MAHDILAFGHDLIAARPRLRQSALRFAKHPDQASEMVQQTMTEAWRARGQYRPGQDLDAWLDSLLRRAADEPRSFARD